MSSDLIRLIQENTAEWPPERKMALMRTAQGTLARETIVRQYQHPAQLAQAIDPTYVITPALEYISRSVEQVLRKPRRHLMVTMPPQEGKSRLCAVWAPLRALQINPNCRIILATYGSDLAEEHSVAARDIVRAHGTGATDVFTGSRLEDKLGIQLRPDRSAVARWRVVDGQGGMTAVGVGSATTGRPADLLIIDDPYKNMAEADSDAHREKVLTWFQSVARTRLSPRGSMILIQCMTGDTPVLRADGSETPLRDIRPGDQIATYADGQLSTSTVRNWANQGADDVLCIRMMSGRTVRANARHPFLTSEGEWKRAGQITSGDRLVALNEERGKPGLPAPSMSAMRLPHAKGCADRTTRSSDGLMECVTRLEVDGPGETSSCVSATASTTTNTTLSSRNRAAGAQSAADFQKNAECRSTGTDISASITATTPAPCADCSATTATSCSDAEALQSGYAPEPTTWSVDEVVSVTPCGREDVFDIQVDRTENFIANGLVSHNTRWHPDDLAAQLLKNEASRPKELRRWRYINIPAVSRKGVPDALKRKPGTAMVSARGRDAAEFREIRSDVGERTWNALYQGMPVPPEGGLFSRSWFDKYRIEELPVYPPRLTVVAVDPSETGTGDEAGIVAASAYGADTVVFTKDVSAALTSDKWAIAAIELAIDVGASEIAIETYTAGSTYLRVVRQSYKTLRERKPHLPERMPFRLYAWRGRGDAVARSGALRQAVETGRARMLDDAMEEMEEQAAGWQKGQHQPDRVAASIIAYDRLATQGSSSMSSPVDAAQRQPSGNHSWLARRVGA